MPDVCRRRFLSALPLATTSLLLGETGIARAARAGALHIGYQKYGTLLLLKAAGTLERQLAPLGFTVTWSEFLSGPPLLEAMNAGAIDFGITGETPPVFAQAAGTPFVYLAADPPAPKGEGILVPADSRVRTVADLRGKHVITTKGSNAHYCLVALLLKAGLKLSEVQIGFLAPPDAFAAFRTGSVDAWCAWDPLFAAAELSGARLLADGTGVVPNHQFFLGRRAFAEANPRVIKVLLSAVAAAERTVQANPQAAAATIGPATGIPGPILARALPRMGYGLGPVTPAIFADQQKIADTFFRLGLIPRRITVTDAAWTV